MEPARPSDEIIRAAEVLGVGREFLRTLPPDMALTLLQKLGQTQRLVSHEDRGGNTARFIEANESYNRLFEDQVTPADFATALGTLSNLEETIEKSEKLRRELAQYHAQLARLFVQWMEKLLPADELEGPYFEVNTRVIVSCTSYVGRDKEHLLRDSGLRREEHYPVSDMYQFELSYEQAWEIDGNGTLLVQSYGVRREAKGIWVLGSLSSDKVITRHRHVPSDRRISHELAKELGEDYESYLEESALQTVSPSLGYGLEFEPRRLVALSFDRDNTPKFIKLGHILRVERGGIRLLPEGVSSSLHREHALYSDHEEVAELIAAIDGAAPPFAELDQRITPLRLDMARWDAVKSSSQLQDALEARLKRLISEPHGLVSARTLTEDYFDKPLINFPEVCITALYSNLERPSTIQYEEFIPLCQQIAEHELAYVLDERVQRAFTIFSAKELGQRGGRERINTVIDIFQSDTPTLGALDIDDQIATRLTTIELPEDQSEIVTALIENVGDTNSFAIRPEVKAWAARHVERILKLGRAFPLLLIMAPLDVERRMYSSAVLGAMSSWVEHGIPIEVSIFSLAEVVPHLLEMDIDRTCMSVPYQHCMRTLIERAHEGISSLSMGFLLKDNHMLNACADLCATTELVNYCIDKIQGGDKDLAFSCAYALLKQAVEQITDLRRDEEIQSILSKFAPPH